MGKNRYSPPRHCGEAGCQGAAGSDRPQVANNGSSGHIRAGPELGVGTEGTSRNLASPERLGIGFPALSGSPRLSLKSNPVAGMGS